MKARCIRSSMINPETIHKLSEQEDRLSTLPKDLINAILTRLPLRDAARTSILSRSWRYHWTNISQLIFDMSTFPFYTNQSQRDYDCKIVKMIDQVLLLHQGPIHKFQLSTFLASCLDMDRWILFVSRNGIRELILIKRGGDRYKVPSCLFSCANMRYLKLEWCTLAPPASFKGFIMIRTLYLLHVCISNSGLENLISNCPLLNRLVLGPIDGCTHLKLYAPNLVSLDVGGGFENICFDKTPVLAKVSIYLWGGGEYKSTASGGLCDLVHLLGSLSSVRRLKLLDETYKILTANDGYIPVKLPTTCQLLHLSLDIYLADRQGMLAALCIFRSSPFLEKINIRSLYLGADDACYGFWEAQEDFNGLFSQLQILNMTEFMGTTAELKFIGFVLANAPVLEMVQIKLDKNYTTNEVEILKRLIRLRRISSKAEIVVP